MRLSFLPQRSRVTAVTTEQNVHLTLHYPAVELRRTQASARTPPFTHWSDCDESLAAAAAAVLFQGGMRSKAARATGSAVTWKAGPAQNKTREED